METMAIVAFAVYAIIILVGGIVAIGSSSLVRALMGLISTLIGVAGMYMLLNTPFMAFMQLLIYVGAVAVLIFFAVMLTNAHGKGDESEGAPASTYTWALGAIMAVGGVLSWLVMTKPVESFTTPAEIEVSQLGQGLLENYFLAFELISVVLLVAMSGAVLLTWEKRRGIK